jgi:hypothetical protein
MTAVRSARADWGAPWMIVGAADCRTMTSPRRTPPHWRRRRSGIRACGSEADPFCSPLREAARGRVHRRTSRQTCPGRRDSSSRGSDLRGERLVRQRGMGENRLSDRRCDLRRDRDRFAGRHRRHDHAVRSQGFGRMQRGPSLVGSDRFEVESSYGPVAGAHPSVRVSFDCWTLRRNRCRTTGGSGGLGRSRVPVRSSRRNTG